MSQYPHLMSPLQIGAFTLKNRIEACPMATSNLTPQAYFTRENIAVFEQRAKGGAAIVNLGEYIAFIKRLVPEQYWEQVFFHNANRIYNLGL